MPEKLLDCIVNLPSQNVPTATIIWLHGLGADGHDFADVVPLLGLPETHQIKFIFPHAPHKKVTINAGMSMPAWFDILAFDINAPQDEPGIKQAQQQILALIQNEIKAGISPEKIILIGFSQGGAIALYTGIHYPQNLGGIAALSSYLPLQNKIDKQNLTNFKLPIWIGHGTKDPIVPLLLGEKSYTFLQTAGFKPSWQTYPINHSVCPEELTALGLWIMQTLYPK